MSYSERRASVLGTCGTGGSVFAIGKKCGADDS
jgi:hypothetical protein